MMLSVMITVGERYLLLLFPLRCLSSSSLSRPKKRKLVTAQGPCPRSKSGALKMESCSAGLSRLRDLVVRTWMLLTTSLALSWAKVEPVRAAMVVSTEKRILGN